MDLLDARATAAMLAAAKPDCIIHAAASHAWRRGEALNAANDELAMGRNLLALIGRMEPRPALVCVGSAAEYGDQGEDPIAEDAALKAISAYGKAKVTLGRAFQEACSQAGVPLVWARCFNLIGSGQPDSAPVANWARQIAMAEDGGEIKVGSLNVKRDFIDVRDAADTLLDLAEKAEEAAGAVNVCSGIGVELREALEPMIQLSGKKIDIANDPELESADSPAVVVGSTERLVTLLGKLKLMPLEQSLKDALADWGLAV
jgi:GDP-4-dehydro-6-deoxy-D-mannose reductase